MKLTRELLKLLGADIDAALKAVGEKHNVVLKTGRCTFSPDNATFKLEVQTIEEGGVVVTKELATLRQLAPSLGLMPEHLTQVFTIAGENCVLAGFINTGGARPYMVKRLSDGKFYVHTRESIARALNLPPPNSGIRLLPSD